MTLKQKTRVPGELLLLLAMITNSLAVSLLIKADFGISALSSVPYVFSIAFPILTNGAWNAIIQSFWLLITMVVIKKVKPGYLLSFVLAFIFGFFLDTWAGIILTWSDMMTARLIYFMAGFFLMTIGIGCFMLCGTPVLPLDTVVRALTMEKDLSVRKARTGFDLLNLTISLAVSLIFVHRIVGIGVGTVVSALFMGTVASKVTNWMKNHLDSKPHFTWLETLV